VVTKRKGFVAVLRKVVVAVGKVAVVEKVGIMVRTYGVLRYEFGEKYNCM
jgi:hypothetical protein